MRLTHEKLLKALEEVHCYVHNLREQKVAIIPLLVKWGDRMSTDKGRGRRYAQRGGVPHRHPTSRGSLTSALTH